MPGRGRLHPDPARHQDDQRQRRARRANLRPAAVALEAWLALVDLVAGPIFRSVTQQREILRAPLRGEEIHRIVRPLAKRAGIDVVGVGAHSLRSGFVTEAARQGVAVPDTMAMTTHRSVETLRHYYRPAELAASPAARL